MFSSNDFLRIFPKQLSISASAGFLAWSGSAAGKTEGRIVRGMWVKGMRNFAV
jgi:hypothetical protein